MSRSYKKYPVHPIACAKSERWDKKFWHSRFRHSIKQHIKTMLLDEDWDIPIFINSIAEVYCFNKDGKSCYMDRIHKTRKGIFEKELICIYKYGSNGYYVITKKELYQLFGK